MDVHTSQMQVGKILIIKTQTQIEERLSAQDYKLDSES